MVVIKNDARYIPSNNIAYMELIIYARLSRPDSGSMV